MADVPPGEVTQVLRRISDGDTAAMGQLVTMLYDELRALAARLMRGERWDHTLQATAVVNEAYVRLMGDRSPSFDDRAHFFGAAAQIMRRVIVDHARKHAAEKRGGGRKKVPLDDQLPWPQEQPEDMVAVDVALTKLAEVAPEKSRIIDLRFFAGLSIEEIAAVLEVSPRTVLRKWRLARAWLFREIGGK